MEELEIEDDCEFDFIVIEIGLAFSGLEDRVTGGEATTN